MCRLKNCIPMETQLTLYNTLVLPFFNYGILAWGNKSSGLIKIQKKCVRLIVSSKYNAHTDPIFKRLELLKISDLLTQQELKFMYKF